MDTYTLEQLTQVYAISRPISMPAAQKIVIERLDAMGIYPIAAYHEQEFELTKEQYYAVINTTSAEEKSKVDRDAHYNFLLGKAQGSIINLRMENFSAGELSDGYHTFNELYYHRMALFSIVCNMNKEKSWKSFKHDDGTMFDDMFIVGINTPDGQYTYHYDVKYWHYFNVQELDAAPVYDGHKPEDITRLFKIDMEG